MDLFILGLYASAILFLGFRAAARRRAGAEDYILASRGLTLPSFVATLVPSFFGGTLGVGEYTYRYGISNWLVQGVPYYLFALLYALFLARRIRLSPGLTLPDHMERAYGKASAVLAALLVFILANPADDVLMLGVLTRWATGWPMALCLLAVTIASVGALFSGGLRSDVWSNCLEFTLMFGGFALILPFAYLARGGLDFLRSHLPHGHLAWNGGQRPGYLLSWFFIALWTFVDPSFHQRVCAAQDEKTARRGICISILFWFLFDAMTTFAGLYARALLPGLKTPLEAYPDLAGLLLPPVLKGLFLAGVASSILAALGTKSFLAAVSLARDAAGRLWPAPEAREEERIRWGLAATSLLSIALALGLPSVVGLWYMLGSTVVPGLLIPVLSIYFRPLRIPKSMAFLCSLGGWMGSTIAWAKGASMPFYPGLAISFLIWLVGKITDSYPRTRPFLAARG